MKPADIYLEAAQRVDEGLATFSCTAVACAAHDAGREYWGIEHNFYEAVFRPQRKVDSAWDCESHAWFGPSYDPECRQVRVLALLFAKAIVESGGLY